MAHRFVGLGGWVLAAIGFGLALASLALPWATYHVSADVPGDGADLQNSGGIAVFQLERGGWYVMVLFVLLGLLAGAVLARGRAARAVGAAAVLLAVAGMIITSMLTDRVSGTTAAPGGLSGVQVRASAAAGGAYGLAALPVLALGAALLSVRTPPQ